MLVIITFLEPRKPSLSIVKIFKCVYDEIKRETHVKQKSGQAGDWNPRPSDCQSDALSSELLETG